MGRKKMSLRRAVAILRLVAADDLSSGRAIDGQNEAAAVVLEDYEETKKELADWVNSLLYSSLLYSTLSIVSPEIPGNAAFSAYPRGYAFKTVFPLRLYCFSWYFGTTARAVSHDPFINFFHLVFHFSGHSGISAPFFCGYPRK